MAPPDERQNVLLVMLAGRIRWRVHKEDPSTLPLSGMPGFELLNPLITRYLETSRSLVAADRASVELVLHDEVMFETSTLGLRVADRTLIPKDEPFGAPERQLRALLGQLRAVSKQAELSRVTVGQVHIELDTLPSIGFPIPETAITILTWGYFWRTAASLQTLRSSPAMPSPPAYEDVMLDAVEAYYVQDYRRALLYLAIAIEAMAADQLDRGYRELVGDPEDPSSHRRVEFVQPGGGVIAKDPIYEFLSARDDFGGLLHERPLYLFKRSLLVDNQDLYRSAKELYRTRNVIVHRAASPDEIGGGFVPLTREGLSRAFESACDIFKWYGADGEYVIPPNGRIDGHPPVFQVP